MAAPYAMLEQLEPGIARLLANNPSPFTFTGTQSYLVGSEELAIIDPGPDLPDHVAALIEAIAGRPVAAILCTHTHNDHSPAARPLAQATGAPVVGCAPLAASGAAGGFEAAFDRQYRADRVLGDGESIQVDGRRLAAVATPGHTSNHLCFADQASGALFTGDHVMGWSSTVVVPPDGDMADYMDSLGKLQARDDRIYYPAHGPAVDGPQELVTSLIDHRLERERQILALIEARARAIPEIVADAYPGLDSRLVAAAGGSVLAHLLDLEARGLVVRTGDIWTRAA